MKTIKTYDDNLKHDGFFFQIPEGCIVWVKASDCYLAGGKHAPVLKRLNNEHNKG